MPTYEQRVVVAGLNGSSEVFGVCSRCASLVLRAHQQDHDKWHGALATVIANLTKEAMVGWAEQILDPLTYRDDEPGKQPS
jgi:hypothetical protein